MSVSFFQSEAHVAQFRKLSGSFLQAVTQITKRHQQRPGCTDLLHKPSHSRRHLPSRTFHTNDGTTSCFRESSRGIFKTTSSSN